MTTANSENGTMRYELEECGNRSPGTITILVETIRDHDTARLPWAAASSHQIALEALRHSTIGVALRNISIPSNVTLTIVMCS